MTKAIKSKVLISVLFIALLCASLCALISFSTSALDTPTASGSCGESVNWEYYESTGELRIFGNGAMSNYTDTSGAPWFAYKANIKTVTIDDGVTAIGNFAFNKCYELRSVEMSQSVKSIGLYAFCKCYSLTSIELPSKLTDLGMFAFYCCQDLESIAINADNSEYVSIDGNIYSKDGTAILQYAPGKTQKSFTIPDSVRSISIGAFASAPLERIIIPKSVKSIDSAAFFYCTSLRSITLMSDEPVTLGSNVFDYADLKQIYVPASSVDAYKAHEDWSEYKTLISSLELGGGIISLGEGKAQAGETVSIDISLENNPGAAIASITLEYDTSALTLINVENGEIFPTLDAALNLLWSSEGDCEQDGVLATLTFAVNEGAEEKDYIISAVFNEAYNYDFESVHFIISDGKITVSEFTYGDVNGDTKVDASDVIMIRKYMAGYDYNTGTSSVTVQFGADTNGDGAVTASDVILLRKYMANYDYDTGSSSVVLGPPKTEPPVTTTPVTSCDPVTTKPVTTEIPAKQIPYKANISIELVNNGNGIYIADDIFTDANTFKYVEKGAGYAKNISAAADRVNKIETSVSYAWDGEYIYGYVVAKDPTLLAVGESIASDPYSNWSYDGFELWYKLGGAAPVRKSEIRQFWASLNGYALNAQNEVKSLFFDSIEWDCEVNRETKTCYLTFKIPARTESGALLEGGDKFYTAIQMDDRRDAVNEVYYCATYNPTRYADYDEYVLAEIPEELHCIPYKADISMDLTDEDGDGVYTADDVFATADKYMFVEYGAGVSKNISNSSDKVNKIETTVSCAWDGEYIYAYVVAKDPTLLEAGENVANDPYKNWSYDGFELWYKLGGTAPASKSEIKQFWASLNGYALNAQDSVRSAHFADIKWDCVVNRDTKTSYMVFKIPAKTESGTSLVGGSSFYVAIQMDDRRDAVNEVYYCATYNQQNGIYERFVLANASSAPVPTGCFDRTSPIK